MYNDLSATVRAFAPEGVGIQNPIAQRLVGQYMLGIITYLELITQLEFIEAGG